MSNQQLHDLGRTLADSFCDGLNRETVLEAIKLKRDPKGATRALVSVWGIEDEELIERLSELGLTTETVAAISLLDELGRAFD